MAAAAITSILVACASQGGEQTTLNRAIEPVCPPQLQGMVTLSGSAVPRAIPADLVVTEGKVKTYDALGRRFLVSIAVEGPARGLRLLSNSLTVATVGGTLKGWAALNAADASSGAASSGSAASRTQTADLAGSRAVEVIPGRIRVAPFLSGTTLHAQTASLDMLVIPGGRQIDAMVASTDAMWTAQRQPVPADELRIALTPIRNLTYFDHVDAHITFVYAPRAARSDSGSQCSVESTVTLVDADSARPALWDIGTSFRGASRNRWLALFDPKAGPTRLIFGSPTTASGFATWARQAGATHVGPYQLGTFEPVGTLDVLKGVPFDREIMDSFQPVSADDLGNLKVGPIGEP